MSLEKFINSINSEKKELCYPKRIQSIERRGREVQHIESGVAEAVRVLERGAKSFVVYGEPQSGKTEFMIALACKLIDLDYQTIFVVMNDNTELESQNFDRFHQAPELNPVPLRDTQIPTMSNDQLKQKKQRIIFCRKNSKNLQKLIQHCRHMGKRIIIDDEADFASPNAKINKNDVTAINRFLGELGKLGDSEEPGTYIGVTATPARLDLNNTFLNDSKEWIFLNSHSHYKGRGFFFPLTKSEIDKSDYALERLPDEGDDPRLLRHAVFRFLCRVAFLNLSDTSEQTPYSMLIHTAGKTNDHEKDQHDLQSILDVLSDQQAGKFEKYFIEMLSICDNLIKHYQLPYLSHEVATFIFRNIGKSEVLVINHKNDSDNVKRAGVPKALFTFAIGGNIVSRGLTFERLLTFFFSRNVKGRLQQNTYIQRARMFGTRPNSNFFELCVPDQLFNDWANCFQDHELSLRLARAGAYQHVQSGRTAVADAGAIDKQNVTVEKSERAVGDKFRLTDAIEERLLSFDRHEPLKTISDLIRDGLLMPQHFPSSLIHYLNETSFQQQKDILIVLRTNATGFSLQEIEHYADGDSETITRARGGIIHAMLNRRVEYEVNNHFILPIKNRFGEARFLYKANLGHSILQNLRVHR
jgi:predicted peroxiredoxin